MKHILIFLFFIVPRFNNETMLLSQNAQTDTMGNLSFGPMRFVSANQYNKNLQRLLTF